MAAPTFNTMHLHLLAIGALTASQVLALYPQETTATLTAAIVAAASKEAIVVASPVSTAKAVSTKL